MSKIIEYYLSEDLVDVLFAPMRSQQDYLVKLLKFIRYIKIYSYLNVDSSEEKAMLRVNKESRAYFFSKNKYFSVCMPFHIEEKENDLKFFSKTYGEIDSVVVTDLLSLFEGERNVFNSNFEYIEDNIILRENPRPGLWELIQDMFCYDSGYLRYDHDQENYNEECHPIDHLDIFCSSSSTFKLGVKAGFSEDDFLDLLDSSKPVKFIR